MQRPVRVLQRVAGPRFFGHRELGEDDIRRCLDEIREIGVEYVDITGGEPTLHPHLAVAVRHAAQIGMQVEVTTNAIRFPHVGDIVPHVSTINISMDTVSAQRYHEIRGTDTLDRTVTLIKRLRAEGARNLKLITVITRRSVGDLDDLVGFARRIGVPAYLSPVFEYFEGQRDGTDPTPTRPTLRLAQVNGEPAVQPFSADAPPHDARWDQASILAAIRATCTRRTRWSA